MMNWTRRTFFKVLGGTAAAAALPVQPLAAVPKAKAVVSVSAVHGNQIISPAQIAKEALVILEKSLNYRGKNG